MDMGFVPISIDKYIKKHLESNPSDNEKDLRKHLNSALADYNKGVKCSCGNDIWVIGSAIKKRENKKGQRHIDQMDKSQIHGFFDDDGYEINTELIKKPSLCITCANDDNPNEELLCIMNRYDQRNDNEFKCFAYKKR
jgi:hypothetical protein